MDKTEQVARHLHYIDWFFKYLPLTSHWDELTQGQRNCYLNYAIQLIKIMQEP
jgi:hypothetical protein